MNIFGKLTEFRRPNRSETPYIHIIRYTKVCTCQKDSVDYLQGMGVCSRELVPPCKCVPQLRGIEKEVPS